MHNLHATALEVTTGFHNEQGLSGILQDIALQYARKDRVTFDHALKVQLYASILARLGQLGPRKQTALSVCGFFHDVGKLFISEGILQKNGRLTGSEYREMKKHAEYGAEYLADFKAVAKYVPAVLYHHERWDGKGYPAGLTKETIPLEARIIAVVDAYDAMTSYRAYKRPLSAAAALIEIANNAGSQFDPYWAKVFVQGMYDAMFKK